MAEFTRVAHASDIPANEGRTVTVKGKPIAVFNVGGRFCAIDGTCPHAGGPLGDGWVQGCIVTCPWHGWQFNVVTGHSANGMEAPLATYEVRIEGDDVLVAV